MNLLIHEFRKMKTEFISLFTEVVKDKPCQPRQQVSYTGGFFMHGNFTETVHKDIYFMNLPSSQIPLDSCVYEGHIFQGPFLEFFIRNSTCKLILIYFAVCMVA